MSLKDDIQAISNSIASADANTKSWTKDLNDLNALKVRATDPNDIAQINKLIDATKSLRKERKDGGEEERRNLEQMGVQNKVLIDLVEKLRVKHKLLANAIEQGAAAYDSFVKKADLGKTIEHLGAMTPMTKTLGTVLGFVVGQAVKFQDRVQAVNKSIIDLSAATGRYTEGLKLADSETLAISEGFAQYGQRTGIASRELQKLAGNLGQVGFSMEEMGIDKQTGKITSLSGAVGGNAKSWGALSASIGIARVTGLEQGQVISQLQTQVKILGGTVESTVKTFASLSMAAGRSKLSTATLLPILQSMQSSFKFLGLDSSAAADMIGKAGEVAAKAGVGAGAAVEVMGKAIAGMAQMDFGQMAFFGQQMGMGGGLAAGFQFRQQARGPGGADMAQQIGQVVGKLMGGTGEIISEGQAASNDQLAAIRLGQEKFAAQTFGFSQNEARAYLNLIKEMEALNASGQGDSQKAEEMKKHLKEMTMGEKEYRAKTLTAQEKIARILELISTLVGRALLVFVRAFAGGAAQAGGLGETLTNVMKSISKGEGLDAEPWEKTMEKVTTSFDNTLKPKIEGLGGFLGKIIGTHWTIALAAVFGAPMLLGFTKDMFSGFLRRALGGGGDKGLGGMLGDLLGKGLRGILGMGRTGTAMAGTVTRDAMGMVIGPATRGASGAMRVLTMNVRQLGGALVSGAGSAKAGLMSMVGALGPVVLGVGALGVAAVVAAKLWESYNNKLKERENKIAGETNKQIILLQKTNEILQKRTGLSSIEARDLAKKVQSGAKLTEDEKRLWESKRAMILRQAQLETQMKMVQVDSQVKAQGGYQKITNETHKQIQDLNKEFRGLGDALDQTRKEQATITPAAIQINRVQNNLDNARNVALQGTGQTTGQAINQVKEERTAAAKEEAKKVPPNEVKVDVNVKMKDDKLEAEVEKGVKKAAEKDIVAPGKSGMSGGRYGAGRGY